MTDHRKAILTLAHENGGTITKKQVVEKMGNWYYANGSKHLGDVLSRMVNAGILDRVKKGHFKIGKGYRSKDIIDNKNQIKLEL